MADERKKVQDWVGIRCIGSRMLLCIIADDDTADRRLLSDLLLARGDVSLETVVDPILWTPHSP